MKNSMLCDCCSFNRLIITKWGTFVPNLMYLTCMYLNYLMQQGAINGRSIDLPVLKEQKTFLLVAKHRVGLNSGKAQVDSISTVLQ